MSDDRALVPVQQVNTLPDIMADLEQRATAYAEQAKAASTRRAYASDWRHFAAWCAALELVPMPAAVGTVLAYLVAHAGALNMRTLQRRLAAIREAHRYAGCELDTSSVAFRDTWRGLRRAHGRPANKRAPLLTGILRRVVEGLGGTLIGRRDRALLLVGFASALRRSELASLEAVRRDGAAGWIEETPDGLLIQLGASKTDQEGEGDTVGVPYGSAPNTCPVRAYRLG